MKLHHIAIWARLEDIACLYLRYLVERVRKYINPNKGFESYFITFE